MHPSCLLPFPVAVLAVFDTWNGGTAWLSLFCAMPLAWAVLRAAAWLVEDGRPAGGARERFLEIIRKFKAKEEKA